MGRGLATRVWTIIALIRSGVQRECSGTYVQANGAVRHADVSTSDEAAHLNDYSFVQAEGRGGALELVDHPLLALGPEYRIKLLEVPTK